MAIGPDRVQVIKQESAALGGDAADDAEYPSPINAQSDVIETAGVYLQDVSNRDENVYIERDGTNMRFRDQVVTTPKALSSIVSHAAEHSAGGLQPVVAQNLSSGGATAGQVMQANGAGLWNLVSVVSGVAAELNAADAVALSTTVSTTFLTKLTLTTTNLPVGDYIIFWSYVTTGSNNNTQVESRVRKDGTTDLFSVLDKSGTAGSQFGNSGHNIQFALSGVHTFTVDYRQAGGSGSAGIEKVNLSLWLIDN